MKKTILHSFLFIAGIAFTTSCNKDVKAPSTVNNSNALAKTVATTTTTQTTTTTTTEQGGHTCGGSSHSGGQ